MLGTRTILAIIITRIAASVIDYFANTRQNMTGSA
jgi:hypothetical protein